MVSQYSNRNMGKMLLLFDDDIGEIVVLIQTCWILMIFEWNIKIIIIIPNHQENMKYLTILNHRSYTNRL